MSSRLWVGLAVSVVCWFAADAVAGALVQDEATQFAISWVLAITAGVIVMTVWRVRALRSGSYKKDRWGVKKR